MKLIDRTTRGKDGGERRNKILAVARRLFLDRGYDDVGMRDIARAAGISPALIYREGWTKADLLAELILEMNAEQIAQIRAMPLPLDGPPIERVLALLDRFYTFDLAQKSLRRLGIAYGWLWSGEQEARWLAQIDELLTPLRDILQALSLDPVEPRVTGIWAAYCASFRAAVFADADRDACIESLRPTIALLVAPTSESRKAD